jgi:hypothetical protein
MHSRKIQVHHRLRGVHQLSVEHVLGTDWSEERVGVYTLLRQLGVAGRK